MPATPAWFGAIEALLNRGIDGSAQAADIAKRLNGTALRVEIDGLTTLRISVAAAHLSVSGAGGTADATIAGSPFALLRLARGAAHGPNAPRATVSGDAEIANLYRQLFARSGPDLEEELSQLIGDMPARRLSQMAAHVLAWGRRTHRTAGENIAEYLQEESRDLVGKPELEEFLHAVDALRETADRVEARLALLERRFNRGI